MIKELFKDIVKYLPSYVVPAIVGIIAIPLVTRLFPPADYGNYVLVLATVSILSAIATAWISASIIRFFPEYKQSSRLKELYSTTIKLTLLSVIVISLIFGCVLFIAQSHLSANLYSLMRIGILVFVVTSSSQIMLGFLRAKRQVTWYSSFTIWHNVAGLSLGIALVVVFGYGVDGLLWGAFLSIIIALPLMWKIAVGNLSFSEGSIRSSMSLEMTKYGFPVIAVNLASWVLSLSDRYILQFFRGSSEVGIYSASYAISEQTILMIASLFMLASAPLQYNIWETQGAKASREFLNKLTRYYLLIGLPATIGICILARPIVTVLTSPLYFEGCKIIPLVAFGAFLVGITHRYSEVLAFYKRTDILMYCMLCSALLNVGLNFLFVPRFGYVAAAATTLVAYVADLMLRFFFSRKFFVWGFPFKSLAKITFASAVMGVAVYPVGNSLTSSTIANLVLGVCVGVIVYVLMLFFLREIRKDEIQELSALRQRVWGRS